MFERGFAAVSVELLIGFDPHFLHHVFDLALPPGIASRRREKSGEYFCTKGSKLPTSPRSTAAISSESAVSISSFPGCQLRIRLSQEVRSEGLPEARRITAF